MICLLAKPLNFSCQSGNGVLRNSLLVDCDQFGFGETLLLKLESFVVSVETLVLLFNLAKLGGVLLDLNLRLLFSLKQVLLVFFQTVDARVSRDLFRLKLSVLLAEVTRKGLKTFNCFFQLFVVVLKATLFGFAFLDENVFFLNLVGLLLLVVFGELILTLLTEVLLLQNVSDLLQLVDLFFFSNQLGLKSAGTLLAS